MSLDSICPAFSCFLCCWVRLVTYRASQGNLLLFAILFMCVNRLGKPSGFSSRRATVATARDARMPRSRALGMALRLLSHSQVS
jgi:hypothetical protein